jgi:hypothetical protein
MLQSNEVLPFSAARFMLDHRYGPVTEHPLGARQRSPSAAMSRVEETIEGHTFGWLPYGAGHSSGWPSMDVIRQYNIDQALQGRRYVSPAPEGSASIPNVRWRRGRWGRWSLVPG